MLVVTIPTSPSLSKTEFVCESYCVYSSKHFFQNRIRKKEKKRQCGWPGRDRGRPQAGPFGDLPGPPAPAGWPQAGSRPVASGYCPAHPAARPAQGRAACLLPFAASFQAGLAGVLAGPRPGRLGRFFSFFVPVFLLQRFLFRATYKRGFFLIFCVDLIPCSLSSIANILRARFLLIPPMILAQV